jgi:cGMP-dependent protein kinase
MQFIRTFKDENNVFFLIEYVRGMELFDVIREIGIYWILTKGLLNTFDS